MKLNLREIDEQLRSFGKEDYELDRHYFTRLLYEQCSSCFSSYKLWSMEMDFLNKFQFHHAQLDALLHLKLIAL